MADMTLKQERNGVPGPGDGHNSAVANQADMVDVPIGEAQTAAVSYSDQGRQVFDGGGLGGTVSFEWDAGLAINDVEGGMSG